MFKLSTLTQALTIAFLTGCTSSGSYTGQLEAQLGATLPDDLRVIARSEPTSTDMTCQTFDATLDASGAFVLNGLCADTTYALSLSNKTLLIEGINKVQGTTEDTPATLMKVWPAPAGNGVAMLSEGSLKSISTYTDIKKLQLLGTQEEVLYPRHKPNSSVVLEEGNYLVIAGQNTLSRLDFHPLIEEKVERSFHDEYTLGPHFYIGLKFSSNTDVERLEALLDTAKVTNVMSARMAVRYIAHDALAPGHYALMGEGDKRMYTITFGPQPLETVSEN